MKNKLMSQAAQIFVLVIAITSSGCALGLGKSLHQYSMVDYTDIKNAPHSRMIEAEADQDVIVATTNTDFADRAYNHLLHACPHGRIVNVTSKHSTELGFLGYRNKMKISGYCLE